MRSFIVVISLVTQSTVAGGVCSTQPGPPPDPSKIQVVILVGQPVHDWRATTPLHKKEDIGRVARRLREGPRCLGPETAAHYALVVAKHYNRGVKERWGARRRSSELAKSVK